MDKNLDKINLSEKEYFTTFKEKNRFKYLSNLNTNKLKKNLLKFNEISTTKLKLSTFLNETNFFFVKINK